VCVRPRSRGCLRGLETQGTRDVERAVNGDVRSENSDSGEDAVWARKGRDSNAKEWTVPGGKWLQALEILKTKQGKTGGRGVSFGWSGSRRLRLDADPIMV